MKTISDKDLMLLRKDRDKSVTVEKFTSHHLTSVSKKVEKEETETTRLIKTVEKLLEATQKTTGNNQELIRDVMQKLAMIQDKKQPIQITIPEKETKPKKWKFEVERSSDMLIETITAKEIS